MPTLYVRGTNNQQTIEKLKLFCSRHQYLYLYFTMYLLTLIFRPFFNLEPRTLKMAAGEKVELTITATSNKTQIVTEVWYLIGSIEGINKKEMLMERSIIAEFVEPKLEISSHCIEFQYDYGPYSEFYKLTGNIC